MDRPTTEALLDVYARLIRISNHVMLPGEVKGMMEEPLSTLSDLLDKAVRSAIQEL